MKDRKNYVISTFVQLLSMPQGQEALCCFDLSPNVTNVQSQKMNILTLVQLYIGQSSKLERTMLLCPKPKLRWMAKENKNYISMIIFKVKIWTKEENCLIFNSLWPNDAIWWHRSGSTLAQVMACCLTAPSLYLKQCWSVISKIQLHLCDGNFTRNTLVIND